MRTTCILLLAVAKLPVLGADTLWVREFGSDPRGHKFGNGIVVTPDNKLYTIGHIAEWPSMSATWAVRRLTLDGETIWTDTFRSAFAGTAYQTHYAYSTAGLLLVAGSAGMIPSLRLMHRYVFALDTSGTELWRDVHESNDTYLDIDVAADNSGCAYFCGNSWTDRGAVDWHIVKYDRLGTALWEQVVDGPAHRNDVVRAVVRDGAGGAFVAGATADSTRSEVPTLVRFDSSGTETWRVRFTSTRPLIGCFDDPIVLGDGSVVAFCDNTAGTEFPVVCFTAAGETSWECWLQGSPRAMTLDPSGWPCLAGQSADGQDIAVWNLDLNGGIRWHSTQGGPAILQDYPTAIATDRLDNVLVTGVAGDTAGGEQLELTATLKLSPSGETLWFASHRHGSHTSARGGGIGADSAGNVYVAARSSYGGGYSRWLTVKYAAMPSGVDEGPRMRAEGRRMNQTIVRDMLEVPRSAEACLLDISGRKVSELQPGVNDIQHVAPGVYFVRAAEGGQRYTSRKVVIER
jgi:hypothetical protein